MIRPVAATTGRYCITLLAFALAADAVGAEASDKELEPPPAARSSIELKEPAPPGDTQTYPGLPDVHPLIVDPETVRALLRQRVLEALEQAPEVDAEHILIHVTSLHAVRLNGSVKDDAASLAAEIIVAGVAGVAEVDNQLVVEADAD